jgi:hypothetical protein
VSGPERAILSIAEVAEGRALVERPAPGRAPSAFRIWGHGPNECDGKTVVFSERSAEALLAEQTARGRLYSFDFDHRSLMPDVSPDAGKASGWHVLEVRQDEDGKPELWAASCDWTADARAGLEADPPEWKYSSPCYEVDPTTREVVSYVNCALTNNPLTYGIPALASAVTASATPPGARLFELHRDEDDTGVSGTGVVASGVAFADGTVALRWRTATASTTIFDDVAQVLDVHGHDGKTRLVYLDDAAVSPAEPVPADATPPLVVASSLASATPPANPGRIALARARFAILRSRI